MGAILDGTGLEGYGARITGDCFLFLVCDWAYLGNVVLGYVFKRKVILFQMPCIRSWDRGKTTVDTLRALFEFQQYVNSDAPVFILILTNVPMVT